MDKNFTMNVSENFDLDKFAAEITNMYQAKGFQVRAVKMNDSIKLVFDKGCGGINTLLGLGLGISATVMFTGSDKTTVSVIFSDPEWTSKILGLVVGWFCCLIPFITAIMGALNQSSLPNEISNDMQMLAASMR